MNQDSACLLRAIRGPVMLITVGALFALDNFTPFGFSRTWPILLVVVGILNLGHTPRRLHGRLRYQAKWGGQYPPGAPPPPPPPPPSAASGPGRTSTAEPGTYRGSPYETAQGSSGPRGSETKQNREKPSAAGPGATP